MEMLNRLSYWLVTRLFPQTAEALWCAGFAKGLDTVGQELGVDFVPHFVDEEADSTYSLWGGNA